MLKKKNQMISPEPSTNDTSIKNNLTNNFFSKLNYKEEENKLSNNLTIIKKKKNIKTEQALKEDSINKNNLKKKIII